MGLREPLYSLANREFLEKRMSLRHRSFQYKHSGPTLNSLREDRQHHKFDHILSKIKTETTKPKKLNYDSIQHKSKNTALTTGITIKAASLRS